MDKLAIVIGNYVDRECDADTTPRQAYLRGFRRATKKCDAVIRSRTAENDALKAENEELREYAHSLEVANIDMASRLEDYIGQYDPTDAYVVEVRAENEKLKEFAAYLVEYVDPAGYQDICNRECPAYSRCYGKSTCAFPGWAIERAEEMGIEVDE